VKWPNSSSSYGFPIAVFIAAIGFEHKAFSEDGIISSKEIRQKVVKAQLSRAWPRKRKGFVFQNSRSYNVNSHNLKMVEETVKVDADAQIALPITFAIDSSIELTGNSTKQLNALANALHDLPEGERFLIEGHTCVLGEVIHNYKLSIARANFVINYLTNRGIPYSTLRALGFGPREAIKDKITKNESEAVLASYRKVMVRRIFNPNSQ